MKKSTGDVLISDIISQVLLLLWHQDSDDGL